MGHIQISHHIFFYQKILKYFNDFQHRISSFLFKVNPSNESETKSDIFLWDVLKSDTISFFTRKY